MTNAQQGGRVALITGASRGIGAGVARLLASRGMRVVVNDRASAPQAEEVVATIAAAGGEAVAIKADVTVPNDVTAMVDEIDQRWGGIDVLVHSVSTPYAIKSFGEISWDELGGKLDSELRAAFLTTKAVVPGMTMRRYGRIVYLGAVVSRRPQEDMIALGTSKAALSSFARFVAHELGPRGITVNVVAPGPVGGLLHAPLNQEEKQRLAAQTVLGRLASADDVARAVAFYAGDDSGFITGTTAPVNGGLLMN